MQIYVSRGEYSLAVKGEGAVGVAYSDGVRTIVLARLASGAYGRLCRACEGNGLNPGKRFERTVRPPCAPCKGTGIVAEYPDQETALAAVRTLLRAAEMSADERADARREDLRAWRREHAAIVAAVTAHADQDKLLRKLVRALRLGRSWTPGQLRAAYRTVSELYSPAPPSRYAAEVGAKVAVTGTVERTGRFMHYGERCYLVLIRGDGDFEGCHFVAMGPAAALRALWGYDGDRVRMKAIVAEHLVRRGVLQTRLRNPRLVERTAQAGQHEGWPGLLVSRDARGRITRTQVRDRAHAHALLGRLFSDMRHGPAVAAVLSFQDSDAETEFAAADVLGEDPAGIYARLLDEEDGDGY